MQESDVNKIIINKMTKAQYDSITPSETELYFITDESGITSQEIVNALGYTPYNGTTNPNGYQANVIETIKVNGTVQTITTKTVDISIPAAPTVDQTYNASSTNAQSGTAVAGALTTKQDTLISGTNIKTINGNSLLGSGDITISGGGTSAWGSITGTLSNQTDLQNALDLKLNISDVQEYTANEIETLWGSI